MPDTRREGRNATNYRTFAANPCLATRVLSNKEIPLIGRQKSSSWACNMPSAQHRKFRNQKRYFNHGQQEEDATTFDSSPVASKWIRQRNIHEHFKNNSASCWRLLCALIVVFCFYTDCVYARASAVLRRNRASAFSGHQDGQLIVTTTQQEGKKQSTASANPSLHELPNAPPFIHPSRPASHKNHDYTVRTRGLGKRRHHERHTHRSKGKGNASSAKRKSGKSKNSSSWDTKSMAHSGGSTGRDKGKGKKSSKSINISRADSGGSRSTSKEKRSKSKRKHKSKKHTEKSTEHSGGRTGRDEEKGKKSSKSKRKSRAHSGGWPSPSKEKRRRSKNKYNSRKYTDNPNWSNQKGGKEKKKSKKKKSTWYHSKTSYEKGGSKFQLSKSYAALTDKKIGSSSLSSDTAASKRPDAHHYDKGAKESDSLEHSGTFKDKKDIDSKIFESGDENIFPFDEMSMSSFVPSPKPSLAPSGTRTETPSMPTLTPSGKPVAAPITTDHPTMVQSPFPTDMPSSLSPSLGSTTSPSISTTQTRPSNSPTGGPTQAPSSVPTEAKTSPTMPPLVFPSSVPSAKPTLSLTDSPSSKPTAATPAPTDAPVDVPTTTPPSNVPSMLPTEFPSSRPSASTQPTVPCNMSPETRSALIISELIPISGLPALVDPTTPQFAAMNWLVEDDDRYLCPDDATLIQRYVLAVVYFGMGGEGWYNCSAELSSPCEQTGGAQDGVRYLSEESECLWFGSYCNEDDGFMRHLNLKENNLAGKIPTEVTELSRLVKLNFDVNYNVTGTIPESIGDLTRLRTLRIDKNKLFGTLPDSLYDLAELKDFEINSNQFSGPISTRIGEMASLEDVNLQDNRFNGTVPTEFGNLKELEELKLHRTDLTGEIPQEICDLNLDELTADCQSPPDPPQIVCPADCCTKCYSG